MHSNIISCICIYLPFQLASVAYPGFQRGGCLRSGPILKAGGGGGGGGGGGVLSVSGPIRKAGGGVLSVSDPIRKGGGGGGGGGAGAYPECAGGGC